jgi:F-type H+-transporting ATPase subunit delta
MSASRVARRYSKALLNLCGGNGSTEAVVGSLEKFAAVVRESPEIVEVLDDPSIDNEARQRTLHKLVPKLGIGGHAANLLYLLGERRRLREVPGILEDLKERLDQSAGRVRASVTSASLLSQSEIKRIKDSLETSTGKTVILETSVDPTLLGGAVTKVGNLVLDGSIRTSLQSVREQLLNAVH